jgi:hypothetical protein
MNNKAELEQHIAKMEEELAQMKEKLSEVEQWEPKGGRWYIRFGWQVREALSSEGYRLFGLEYQTQAQATKAAKAMRTHNRLLAYVAEHAPGYEADWRDGEEGKWFVYFDHVDEHRYIADSECGCEDIGKVYMPETVAKELARKLSSGEVVL